MKKIIAIALALILVATVAGAASGIAQVIWPQMQANIKANTDAKLTNLPQDSQAVIERVMAELMAYQTQRANKEIDAHYEQVLANLETNPAFASAMNELVQLTNQYIITEKARIDADIAAIFDN